MGRVRLRKHDNTLLALLEARGHPMSVSDITLELGGTRKASKSVLGSLIRLEEHRAVWRPLTGHWAYADGKSSERFFSWLSVLADGLEDRSIERPTRARFILSRFCAEYGSNRKIDAAVDCTLLRPTLFQAYLVLLNQDPKAVKASGIARAVVQGLADTPWLEPEQIAQLIPQIVAYENRLAKHPGMRAGYWENQLTLKFLLGVARNADLDLDLCFVPREET